MELKSRKVFSFVSEPDLVLSSDHVFEMSESQFLKFKNDYFEQFDELSKLRPNDNLKLVVDNHNFSFSSTLNKSEFDVLCSIVEYSVVKDIYENCDLLDFDITTALISLRKKGVLKVLQA